jgi:hypothetical protein
MSETRRGDEQAQYVPNKTVLSINNGILFASNLVRLIRFSVEAI